MYIFNFIESNSYRVALTISMEMGLEPVPLQLEHVATNRSRNHHSTHLGQDGWNGGCYWNVYGYEIFFDEFVWVRNIFR